MRTLAEQQIQDARRDPRLGHGPDAVIGDWIAAMAAAERSRTLARWGLDELLRSAEPARLQDSGISGGGPHLDAAKERVQLARAEKHNRLAEHNAMTLIMMVGALDALVEGLAPRARSMQISMHIEAVVGAAREAARQTDPDAAVGLDPQIEAQVRAAARTVIDEILPQVPRRPTGTGVLRWETLLEPVGLHAPPSRPIPEDLDAALGEATQLRHVLVHRAGRVDGDALSRAPSLRLAQGELVRITHDDHRRYSAALRAYGTEIMYRVLGSSMADPPGPLADWRDQYLVAT